MAVWQCTQCGYEKDARCKPRKCPECGAKDSFTKKDASTP
ncbi:RCKP-type rubredoxin-like domain-containing protein [Moorella stamsii (nom. illeg.)]